VVTGCPPFSSYTTAPDIGVVPVSVTIPLIFAIQSETPAKPASKALIKIIKTFTLLIVIRKIDFIMIASVFFFPAPLFVFVFKRVALPTNTRQRRAVAFLHSRCLTEVLAEVLRRDRADMTGSDSLV
jgi:hypothetical protein